MQEVKKKLSFQIQEAKQIGTMELGSVDRVMDGESTRRRRRKVIVIEVNKGDSLDSALVQSAELRKLGL